MSETLMHTIVDCSTGTVEQRPFTAEEIAQREADAAAFAEQQAALEAEAAAKAAARASAEEKLAKLGLTADEISAMLG